MLLGVRALASVCLILLALPAAAGAQARLTGADLSGTVTDQTGAALPGVSVTATNADTNVARSVTTDQRGRFTIAALPPGTYKVTASISGFVNETRDQAVLQLGQAVVMDFQLKVAGTAEAITVLAESPVVAVSHTEVSSVVNQQQIENLPINGRNFISFAVITPGVTTDRTPQQGASATSGLSFTGQRARSNNIMVDGLDNNDQVVGAVRSTFSQEAVREFQVLTNSYSAEFGKATGGVVNIVTRSGTNTFSGNVFAYFRDDSLNAKSYFEKNDIFGNAVDLGKSPFEQTQWGATLGGPIKRDRTFFFASFERADTSASNLVTIQANAAALLNGLGFPVELGNVPYDITLSQALAKVDHQWNANHSLVVRGNWADVDNENIEPFGGSIARSRGAVQLRTDWSLSASQTDVVANKWISEFRVQYAPQDQEINSLDPRCGGPCTLENQGGPTLEITGVASVGRQRFTPQPRRNRRLQLLETVSLIEGAHHLKAGIEFNDIKATRGALPLHFGGRYIFSAVPAAGIPSALAALQLGLPAVYVQGYGTSEFVYPARDLSLFLQDEWNWRRLVVKPGVRYQRQLFSDLADYDIGDVSGTRLRYPLPEDSNDVAPRIAVAYDVTGSGKSSVHGSYGMFHENTLGAIAGVTQILTGTQTGVRTLVVTLGQTCAGVPCSVLAWNSPGRRLSEQTAAALLGGFYPTLVFAADPGLETPYAHQAAIGFDHAITNDLALNANFVYVRGFEQIGTIDYNPVLPARLGAARRPNDLPCSANPAAPCVNGGIPGTSASVLQYSSFGETEYRGLTLSVNKRFNNRYQFLASYTLSKAEDNSTDFQSNFIPQANGFGRDPGDKTGVPLGFNPDSEWGPATHDQRHRFVLSGVTGVGWDVWLSAILTGTSGRPFTPLAGADLNGDGNGGAFPPDRARTNPLDEASSVGRNSETTAGYLSLDFRVSKRFRIGARGTIDAILDAFNLFNRVNFFENTNQGSFTIFGTGAYPSNSLPTYGRYTETLPPRQIQLAVKVGF
jgi:Carboxypeptidase regulatory-like domain/TonB-dependent Receptor Plug Domain